MEIYLRLIRDVLQRGIYKNNRTNTDCYSLFGYQMRFDLSEGFPLVTTKKIYTKAIVHELLWFLQGNTNITYLQKNGISIWDEWADDNGDLGPIYGIQWRAWPNRAGQKPIDQISNVIKEIQSNPTSRRLVVSSWNVSELPNMALAPCHVISQYYVSEGKLSCQVYQRSADIFLGLPFNIASYSLLLHMMAQVCQLKAHELIYTLGDAHLYTNHQEQAHIQLQRSPMPLPTLTLKQGILSIFDFKYNDIKINNYRYHPPLKAEVAI